MGKRIVTVNGEAVHVHPDSSWRSILEEGINRYFSAHPRLVERAGGDAHTVGTAARFARYLEHFANMSRLDPKRHLEVTFPDISSEMIAVYGITANSFCCHHLLPVLMRVDFAYINDSCVVGLSKIPRFIKEHAALPQTQEHLTQVIGLEFNQVVKPKGVAVAVTGLHTCMACRGVETPGLMRTTYLSGPFREDGPARGEFLSGVLPPGSFRI